MNRIAEFVKIQGKAAHLSREKFAELSGLGVRFIRKLESGKDGRKIERCYFKKEDLEKVKDLLKEKSLEKDKIYIYSIKYIIYKLLYLKL